MSNSENKNEARLEVDSLRAALNAAVSAVPPNQNEDDASQMRAYMKGQFNFFGLKAPILRREAKPFLALGKQVSAEVLIEFIDGCWEQPEREFQYVGALMARRHSSAFEPSHLDSVEQWLVTKSWWDTIDVLAAWTIGPMVATYPDLGETMDRWIGAKVLDTNMWLARTAILHQLSYKEATNTDRLFGYAERRAADKEFFIRKALGWSLRQYARQDPEAVRTYVLANEEYLSGLTVREALKRIGRS